MAKTLRTNTSMPASLYQPLWGMADWQQQVFGLALCERIYPHFALYAELANTGDTQILRTVLDTLWQVAAGQGKCHVENQLEKIESITINHAQNFGASLAHDVQVAVMLVLNSMVEVDTEEVINIGLLAQESVIRYLRLTLADKLADGLSDDRLDDALANHTLMQQELDFQQHLLTQLQPLATPKAANIQALKQYAQNDGISNIGIDARR